MATVSGACIPGCVEVQTFPLSSSPPSGSSDPYVKFKVGRVKLHRSSVVHRNLNPVWNESFDFQLSDLCTPLRIKVYDYDYGSMDDYMGGASLSLEGYADDQ